VVGFLRRKIKQKQWWNSKKEGANEDNADDNTDDNADDNTEDNEDDNADNNEDDNKTELYRSPKSSLIIDIFSRDTKHVAPIIGPILQRALRAQCIACGGVELDCLTTPACH